MDGQVQTSRYVTDALLGSEMIDRQIIDRQMIGRQMIDYVFLYIYRCIQIIQMDRLDDSRQIIDCIYVYTHTHIYVYIYIYIYIQIR